MGNDARDQEQREPQGSGEQRGGLTGSGALQLVQTVTENPTVAGVVAVAAAKVLISGPKDPPSPPPPTDPPAA